MSDTHGSGSVAGALGSVRELEQSLEASSTAKTAAEARLADARSEAARILASAQEEAAAEAAERRRAVLVTADDDAAVIRRQAEERRAELRAAAEVSRGAAVEAALALVLPTVEERNA